MSKSRSRLLTAAMVVSTSTGLSCASNADEPQDAARRKLLQTFVDEFVPITPGRGDFPKSFQMGTSSGASAEQPVHEVKITRDFSIAKYEVPQNLYEAVMGANPSRWKGPRNSAEMMTWRDSLEFCRRITQTLREAKLIGAGVEVRLPTEAEWEYCCRAGTTTAYSFGEQARADGDEENKATLLDPYGWHTGNAAGNDPPVGALKPNPWGLYDVHGYLAEFCLDAWHADYADAPADGSAWGHDPQQAAGNVVIRGGSWKDKYPDLRSAARKPFDVTKGDDAVGFRCVMVK
jgi:formylglycine-generating enzyme required for sulfatase activity